jgi:hypothetical protein
MKILNHIVEANLSSRHPWTHFKIHKSPRFGPPMYRHLVWGKLSVIFGQPHLMPITVCAHCNEEIRLVGEDSLDWCESCQSLEGDTRTITMEEFEALG